jgi:hypothetical protein
MRATIVLAAVSLVCLAASACRNNAPYARGSTGGDAGTADAEALVKEEAGSQELSLEFPSEVPAYPGAPMSPTTRVGREGKPHWTGAFRTSDDPGKVLLFYLQSLRGFKGSGDNQPNGEIRGAWESPKYHVELHAAPLRVSPDAAPFVTSVVIWVDGK